MCSDSHVIKHNQELQFYLYCLLIKIRPVQWVRDLPDLLAKTIQKLQVCWMSHVAKKRIKKGENINVGEWKHKHKFPLKKLLLVYNDVLAHKIVFTFLYFKSCSHTFHIKSPLMEQRFYVIRVSNTDLAINRRRWNKERGLLEGLDLSLILQSFCVTDAVCLLCFPGSACQKCCSHCCVGCMSTHTKHARETGRGWLRLI